MKTGSELKRGIVTKAIDEKNLDSELNESIRRLLSACFDWTPEFKERSYWHLRPDVRILSMDESTNRVLGHMSIVDRSGVAQDTKLHIAGVGGFAIQPAYQAKGIGTQLAKEAVAYAHEKNYDLIVGFAKDPRSRHICIELGAVPTKDVFIVTYPDGEPVLKPHTLIWPLSEEKFDLVTNSQQPIDLGYGAW